MKRMNLYRPTVEDCVELAGIEALHPGGLELTRRTAVLAGLKPGMKILDVSSGRGTNSVFYAQQFGVEVIGVDIAQEMVDCARHRAQQANVSPQVSFVLGDSQALPFADNTFDAVINECAVGIPDDSALVVREMARVLKPGGRMLMHESTWRGPWTAAEKSEIAERYGTTPLELAEWQDLIFQAGLTLECTEFDQWSKPEYFWQIRIHRKVQKPTQVLSLGERLLVIRKILFRYGLDGLKNALTNERHFYSIVQAGRLGYCLLSSLKPEV